MLKETITYTDFNDVERTEELYFNLTKSELVGMNSDTKGGLVTKLNTLIAAKDAGAICSFFEFLVEKSYGIKSEDGKRFEKSEAISKAFKETLAYDQIYMKLVTDADYAAKFVNGIIPADLRAAANK